MKIVEKIRAGVELIRPELPLTAGICVIVGQTVALGEFAPVETMLQGFLLGFFLSSSAMIFNDYFDIAVDRVNSPHRPLASGRITKTEAIFLGIGSAVLALGVAISIAPLVFLASLLLWVLGFFYNWKWKARGLLGNLVVSINVAMTFLAGAFSVGQIGSPAVWLFSLVAFLFDLGEEIAGDAMDMEGDRARGSRSLAIEYGRIKALRISASIFFALILVTLIPLVAGYTSAGYAITIIALDTAIAVFGLRILRSETPWEGRRAMRGMYLAAAICLIFYVFWLNWF
jgi:geranylgeranylglycerol-phosphate geranylgeranyltransferase